MPPKKSTAANKTHPLLGKRLVFTGALKLNTRAVATKLAEGVGAIVTTAVSGNTDILVAGSGAGQKIADASAKGVVIWTEEEFVSALEGGAAEGKSVVEDNEQVSKPAPKSKGKGKAKVEEDIAMEVEEPVSKPAPKCKGKGKAKVEDVAMEVDEPKPAAKGKGKAAAKVVKEEAPASAVKKGKKRAIDEAAEAESKEQEEEPVKSVAKTETAVAATSPTKSVAPRPPGVRRADNNIPQASFYNVYQDYDTKLVQTNIVGPIGNNKVTISHIKKNYSLTIVIYVIVLHYSSS
jgi:hypothetical protein